MCPLSQLSLLSCQIRNFGTRSRFMLGLTSNTAMPWLVLEVMTATEMFVTLPGNKRLQCCANELRSAGLAWEVFGVRAVLEMITRSLHDWGSAREDTMGTSVIALC